MIGLIATWLASKHEDPIPIFLEELFKDVGHSKYSKSAIKETEIEVLQVIGFNLCIETFYERATNLMRIFMMEAEANYIISDEDKNLISDVTKVLSLFSFSSLRVTSKLTDENFIHALNLTVLRFLKQKR